MTGDPTTGPSSEPVPSGATGSAEAALVADGSGQPVPVAAVPGVSVPGASLAGASLAGGALPVAGLLVGQLLGRAGGRGWTPRSACSKMPNASWASPARVSLTPAICDPSPVLGLGPPCPALPSR